MEPRIVRRYASALFQAASKVGVVDRIESDLGLISYTMESSPKLKDTIESPIIPVSKKQLILKDIFADKVHEITIAYLNLLTSKRREEAIGQTEGEYVRMANAARGIVSAEVTTAVELGATEEAALITKLVATTGKTIELEKHVDPSIIGGIILRIGDRVVDGSIKGQLAALREKMLS